MNMEFLSKNLPRYEHAASSSDDNGNTASLVYLVLTTSLMIFITYSKRKEISYVKMTTLNILLSGDFIISPVRVPPLQLPLLVHRRRA